MSTAALPTYGRARSPWVLSKHSVSYCTWEGSLTALQGQPLRLPRWLLGTSQVLSEYWRAPWPLPNSYSYRSRAAPPPAHPRGCSQPSGYCCAAG